MTRPTNILHAKTWMFVCNKVTSEPILMKLGTEVHYELDLQIGNFLSGYQASEVLGIC